MEAGASSAPSFVRLATNRGSLAFNEEALALKAAEMLHSFGTVRRTFQRAYQRLWTGRPVHKPPRRVVLPRYAGAGETAIHKAIRDAERLILAGDDVTALSLLVELMASLHQALETRRIEPLMDKWNMRYPSDLPVEVIELADLRAFLSAAREVWHQNRKDDALDATHTRSGDLSEAEDETFVERLHRRMAQDLEARTMESGYASPMDLLSDYIDAADVEASFTVHIPEALEAVLKRGSPLPLVFKGLPSVTRIVHELETQYPSFVEREWHLRIDGEVIRSTVQTVLPSQKLELVIPGSSAPQRRFGPGSPTLPTFGLIVFLLFPALSLSSYPVATAATVCALTEPKPSEGKPIFRSCPRALPSA